MVMTNIERKWMISLVIISAFFFIAEIALRMLTQLYLRGLQVQPVIISLSTTLVWLGVLLGSPLWGGVCDRWPRRSILFLISFTYVLVTGAFAFLLPLFGFLPLVLLRGFIIAGLTPVTMSIVAGMSSSHNRGRNFSFLSSSQALGWTLGSVVVGFLLVALGFRWSFLVLASLPFFALLLLFCLPEQNEGNPKIKETTLEDLKRKLRGLYLGAALRWMGTVGSYSLIYVHMASLGISPESMGLISALGPAMSVLGMLFFGWLGDRVIRRRRIFLFGFCLSVFVPLIFAYAQGVWSMAAGFLALGISSGSVYVGSTAYISDIIPMGQQGVMLGLFEANRGLGGVLGPLIAGAITPIFGFRGMFLTMEGIVALGFLLVLFSPSKPSPSVRNGH